MAARIRMNGVADDALIPTPPTGKASLFYNNVLKVYRAKLDDGTVITLSSDPEFIQDTVGAMFQDSSTVDFTYDDAGNIASVEVIQSSLDTTIIPNTPSGNLTATNVQDALNELQGDIDNIVVNFDETAQDAIGSAISAGTQDGISVIYNDPGNAFNFSNLDKGSVAVTAHESALDPHPQYETSAEAQSKVDAHANLTNNPHSVTATQLGLGNVDNTSDLDKPISTATQDALDLKYDASNPNNYIDSSGAPVQSVNAQTGVIVLDADDIDDTSTTNKFATQSELDQIATINSNTITIPVNGGLASSGTLGGTPEVSLDLSNLTFAPLIIDPLSDRIAFLDATDSSTKSTVFQFAFDFAVANNSFINSIISANGSIDTHSDVDTSTTTPDNFTILVYDGTNWVPANAIGSNSININKQLIIDYGENPQTGSAIIINTSQLSGDALLINNSSGDEVFSIRTNVLDHPNVVWTDASGTEIAVFNQNGLRLFNSIYINELSDDETFADESINAVVSERAIKAALDTKQDIFDPQQESYFFDDFFVGTVQGLGWNIVTVGAGSSANQGFYGLNNPAILAIGIQDFKTGSTASGVASLARSIGSIALGVGFSFEQTWRAATQFLSTPTEQFVTYIGLIDSQTITASTDGIYFVYSDSLAPNYLCVTRNANVQTITDSGVAANTNYNTYKITVNDTATEVNFFINDVLVATHSTNIPGGPGRGTGIGATIAKITGTTSRSLFVDFYEHKFTISGGR